MDARNGIQFEMQQNEPEDHLGVVATGGLAFAENDRHHECEQLPSARICFRGRPAFWTYLSIMPGIRFIRR